MKYYNSRKNFFKLMRNLALFSLPFMACAVVYVHDDPFRVLRRYNNYDTMVRINENYVGWQIYKTHVDSLHYNSYILGNSCTMAFRCRDWERHLDSGDRAIRLYANAESLKAIDLKLRALDKAGASIKNVLLVLDANSLSKTQLDEGYTHALPPDITGGSNCDFQLRFVQAFFRPEFLFKYFAGKLTGHYSPKWKDFNTYGHTIDPLNNDLYNPREKMIAREGKRYWTIHAQDFPSREATAGITRAQVIWSEQNTLLHSIAGVLARHHARVKVLLSPEYDQSSINPRAVSTLKHIFGKNNVYDFSGVNIYSSDLHNFYEKSHYRPVLGRKLLDVIYSKEQYSGQTRN